VWSRCCCISSTKQDNKLIFAVGDAPVKLNKSLGYCSCNLISENGFIKISHNNHDPIISTNQLLISSSQQSAHHGLTQIENTSIIYKFLLWNSIRISELILLVSLTIAHGFVKLNVSDITIKLI